MLTSSVEYGLQDLCKVWPCLDWGQWSRAEEHPKMAPAWLVAGGDSEDGTVVCHPGPLQAQPLLWDPGGSVWWDPP